MKIELKNIKVHERLSEETACFSATIYVDGKKAGEVTNRGCGGCNEYYWIDQKVGAAVDAYCKSLPCQFEFEHTDQFIDDLVAKHRDRKHLEQLCKKKTLFRLKGDEKAVWRILKVPFSPDIKSAIAKKYGDKVEIIANENVEQAVEVAFLS
jgi:hypothetical protein